MTQLSEAPPLTADVRITELRKSYGPVVAVGGIDLEIERGEFFTMLGPSGSGKTTTLRMIAGFERPDAGTIELDGKDVASLPPFDRDVNTVFQDYALFPHMTVQQNVEYGLRVKRVPKADRRLKAQEALAMVRLEGYGDRKPGQLSGGQRQRVALARAIVNTPRALLLDEPLGALDLRRTSGSFFEASADLGATGFQTFRYVTLPVIGTALVAGALLAFALSWDEIVVTYFTAGAQNTLPLLLVGFIRQGQNLPIVNAIALVVIVVSLIPVALAQRLTSDPGAGRG